MQMSWKPLSKKHGLPHHLSSATNWSSPCHAELRQQLKQKESLPSIEYIRMAQKANNSQKKKNVLVLWSILICWDSELVGFC